MSGITDHQTNGGPVSVVLENVDDKGRSRDPMGELCTIDAPRPGHGDLAGALKWRLTTCDEVAELASGRITAAHTIVGAICQMMLSRLGMELLAHVVRIGRAATRQRQWTGGVDLRAAVAAAESSALLTGNARAEKAMTAQLEVARECGDSVGGFFAVVASPGGAGLGRPQPAASRLDGRLASVIMAIPGVRAVALGHGLKAGGQRGSRFHDTIRHSAIHGFRRRTNRAGGIEAGMTNGEPIVVKGVMKPVPSLASPLASVSLESGGAEKATRIRSDVCAVAPAAVAGRALTAYVLAAEILEETGGSLLEDVYRRYHD